MIVSTQTNLKKDIELDCLLRQRNRYNKHVMVSEINLKTWKGLLLFLEEAAIVGGDYNLKIVTKHLYVIRRLSGGQKFTTLQDRGHSRTTNSVTNYLNENIGKENWSPNFSDLSPLDYANWDMMERWSTRT